MTRAVLSLGSNLGDRYAHLRGAVGGSASASCWSSGVYETPPWGDTDQPRVPQRRGPGRRPGGRAGRLAGPGPRRCEAAAGRVRDPERRFGPRTLDVDVIAVWHDDGTPVLSDDPELTLPHPRAHLRAFVLGRGSTSSRTGSCPATAG